MIFLRSLILISCILILTSCINNKTEDFATNTKIYTIWDKEQLRIKTKDAVFYIESNKSINDIKSIKYSSGNGKNKNNLIFNLDFTPEVLSITNLKSGSYGFVFSSLGSDQCFLYNPTSNIITKLYCDIYDQISINSVDWNHEIIIANSHNSDKDISLDEKVDLYLFSNKTKKTIKVASAIGCGFNVELLGNKSFMYSKNTNNESNNVIYSYAEY